MKDIYQTPKSIVQKDGESRNSKMYILASVILLLSLLLYKTGSNYILKTSRNLANFGLELPTAALLLEKYHIIIFMLYILGLIPIFLLFKNRNSITFNNSLLVSSSIVILILTFIFLVVAFYSLVPILEELFYLQGNYLES